MPKNILLLTATVKPPEGMPLLARTDPGQRLQDYSNALKFYCDLLGSTFDAIVFAENSQYDLSSLRAQVEHAGVADKVEFLSFDGLAYPSSYGRGYGEFYLVDYATSHSSTLASIGDGYLWKCTGRYIVKNIAALVRDRPQCDLYCHLRNYPYRLCELFLLSWNSQAYRIAIQGAYRELRNDIVPGIHTFEEKLFRDIVDNLPSSLRVVRRFRRIPVIEGTRGWSNKEYRNLSKRMIAMQTARIIAPWLWL